MPKRTLLPLLMAACLPLAAFAASDDADLTLHTNHGEIAIELFQEQAPQSVNNFLTYVQEGHYAGTLFHRVIDGFMIQGGGFDRDLRQKPTRDPVTNEADNGLSNDRGTLAMARTGDPHSATAQFFINVADNDFLDHQSKDSGQTWGYAVFGRVIEGMDVVDAIARVPTGSRGPFQDVPEDPVVIESAEIH
ncbi:peptidyl-prolyl cis-trans isomerase B (cyclophilin B) [Billgrantia gudaonensis]|uniref:Peptidyl-prolyl cis-trans isomerase n=2 Tax=Billgrantia gudaonensis TaxID=376427 RepID=A0A1G8PQN8_9GAMM|nr:peptidyl-prolyl cis-trans isomerase B (cyclophilin B) [Halomonas gudaonensis]